MRLPLMPLAIGALLLAGCAAPPAPSPAGTTWEWIETRTTTQTLQVADPSRYTLRVDDGWATVRADCNRGRAAVAMGAQQALSFKSLAMTRAMCPPDSQSDRFTRDLDRTARWALQGDALQLELADNAGTMRLRRAAAP